MSHHISWAFQNVVSIHSSMAAPRILAAAHGWVSVVNFGRCEAETLGWKVTKQNGEDEPVVSSIPCDTLAPGECIRIKLSGHGKIFLQDMNDRVLDQIFIVRTKVAQVFGLDERLRVSMEQFKKIPNAGVGIICVHGNRTVTIANLSGSIVDLNGWILARTAISGVLTPGDSRRFDITPQRRGEWSWFIELTNPNRQVIDAVQYIKNDSQLKIFDSSHRKQHF